MKGKEVFRDYTGCEGTKKVRNGVTSVVHEVSVKLAFWDFFNRSGQNVDCQRGCTGI
jgi:hypothetical protein